MRNATRDSNKVRIGLLSLTLELYLEMIPDTVRKYEDFHGQYKTVLNTMGEVVVDAFCCRREEIEAAVRRIEATGADVLVIVLQSYSPSLASLPALLRTSLPLLIWNTQTLYEITPDLSVQDVNENHGLHGTQDLTNCLRRARRPFGIVSGHRSDESHLADLRSWLRAAQAVSLSRCLKVGLIGEPFQGMGDFCVDETIMASTWGPSVERLTLDDLVEALEEITDTEMAPEMAHDREIFDFSPDIDEEDHRRSAKLSLALRRVVKSRGLDAITFNFASFGRDTRIETVPYLGLAHLMAEGCGYAGEGNVTVAALVALLARLFGRANFTEIFTADYKNNRLFFYHMAEGNYAMAKAGERPRLKKIPFFIKPAKPYLTPVYAYAPGPSTFVNITTDAEGRFYLIAFEGEVLDFSQYGKFNAPHFLVQLDIPTGRLLDLYGLAGGTHHLCRIEGRRIRQIGAMAQMLGMELKVL